MPGGLIAWCLVSRQLNGSETIASVQSIQFNQIHQSLSHPCPPCHPALPISLNNWRGARQIDAALDRYTDFSADCPGRLREAIRYSLLAPGKRLRPMLVLFAAEACGSNSGAAIPAACAVEMVHTYSLIHDDLPAMDDDDLRRGRPTCHKAFGEAVAILAGDALLALAFEVLASHVHPPLAAARCCAVLAEAAGATALVGGQADDLALEFTAGDMATLENIHRRKTGAMFVASLRLAGYVAGADAARQGGFGAVWPQNWFSLSDCRRPARRPRRRIGPGQTGRQGFKTR